METMSCLLGFEKYVVHEHFSPFIYLNFYKVRDVDSNSSPSGGVRYELPLDYTYNHMRAFFLILRLFYSVINSLNINVIIHNH